MAALEAAYARGENDEFVKPTVIAGHAPMRAAYSDAPIVSVIGWIVGTGRLGSSA